MFGYLQIDKAELKVREYEAYKSVYCGLCKQLGRDYSIFARFALSYDCTFYAITLMSLRRSCSGFKDGRCRFNPLKKCKYARCEDDCYSKAAALTVISVYYKLCDDISDSGFFKALAVRLIKPFFSHWRKKAAKRYPELDIIVRDMLNYQIAVEQKDKPSLDEAAHPTAYMLAEIMKSEGKTESDARVLYECGYHLGRWVYLMDAADDYEKDKKRGNFNPFLSVETDALHEYMGAVLSQSLARAYDAYNLLNLYDFKGILDNMMLFGFDSPLADVAEQKMKEVNEAYDEINRMRQKGKGTGSTGSSSYSSSGYNSSGYGYSKYNSVRIYIQRNMINEAENVLNGIPENERDAEWHFLRGMCFYRRGWSDQANVEFQTAVNMDPNNQEYRTAVNNMNAQRTYNYGGYNTANTYDSSGCSVCDICSALMCANCICSCCRSC